ncbi:F-box/kelch-repeat protein SKIP6 [Morus notabilis]|uniref:F-box/kelch-repeat protein SKIP6 n=1 Tax=Morus notabilis TaxID=981085 RepID=W9SAK7_9ROSA|nr:F-box/kelch-repeat protein SKIP6 [Morus notabilis]XP_024029366.1 F-box/kelch-repeat protein SKIP6 [Morus notabilis]EXC19727.1 F-box/kelch-repeat protein SKIP6 [Morus notabilis]
MSTTTTEAPPGILIPSLPNDVALQCLARVPRQYHPVLAAVSKPIRSLLSSPELFAARSSLNSTESLLYLTIRSLYGKPKGWFTVYGRRSNTNDDNKSNIIVAPVPGVPKDRLDWSDCAAVGSKIYVVGGINCVSYSTKVWIFDCRFHTWERGPGMPTVRSQAAKTVVLDSKIYVIGCWTEKKSWVLVFDTVARSWETLPSPKLGVYNERVVGCTIRGGKVCVWLEREEIRFDPATETWEVFESGVRPGFHWTAQMCEVNGVLYCADEDTRTIRGLNERNGIWKELKLVNNRGLPNRFRDPCMVNVGGRLVIMGLGYPRDEIFTSELELWCAEIEVKMDRDGDLLGEVLWSKLVFSMSSLLVDMEPLFYTCLPVSF